MAGQKKLDSWGQELMLHAVCSKRNTGAVVNRHPMEPRTLMNLTEQYA